MTVVDRIPDDQGTVFFGAWVTLVDENDQRHRYRIVGADEIDAAPGYISVDSPLARLLLKKSAGDEVALQKPDGSEVWYEILAVAYQAYETRL
jgi:transcription elongation factor GreB